MADTAATKLRRFHVTSTEMWKVWGLDVLAEDSSSAIQSFKKHHADACEANIIAIDLDNPPSYMTLNIVLRLSEKFQNGRSYGSRRTYL